MLTITLILVFGGALLFISISFWKFCKDFLLQYISEYLRAKNRKPDYSALLVYVLSLVVAIPMTVILNILLGVNFFGLLIGRYLNITLPAISYIVFWLYILKHKQKNIKLIRCYTLMWAIDAVLVILMKMNTFGSINETVYKAFKIFNYPLVMEWDYYHFFLNIDNHWFNYLLVMLVMSGVCIRYLLINRKSS